MSRPWLRIAVLAYVGWWFVWFAPSHPRGKILALGSQQADSCCPSKKPETGTPEDCEKPFQGTPTKQCAVCFLVARMDVPPQADLTLYFSGLCRVLDWPAPLATVYDGVANTHLGRAPPAGL